MKMDLNETRSAKVKMRVGNATDKAKTSTSAQDAFKPLTIHSMKTEPAVKSDKA